MGVLVYTGSTPADSTEWQLIGGLIGGGVFLLTILAGLIIVFRYKPNPDPDPDHPGNVSIHYTNTYNYYITAVRDLTDILICTHDFQGSYTPVKS